MKKLVSIALVLAMIFAFANVAGAEEEHVVVSIYTNSGSEYINEDNPMYKFIEEQSGVHMDMIMVTGDATEKLNMLLVGGDYPDIILTNDNNMKLKLVEEGFAIAIDEYIDEMAPNLKAAYGEKFDTLYHEDGHIYGIGSGYTELTDNSDIIPASWTGYTFNIREDMWEALGKPEITDLDSIYNILVKMKEVEATNVLGTDYYPMGGYVQSWQNMLETLIQNAGGFNGRYYIDENDQLSYWVRAPWALEIVKFYNKITREGLLDPEAYTMDRGTFCTQKIGGDQIKSYFGMHYYVNDQVANLNALGVEDGYWQNFPFTVTNGQHQNLISENPIATPNFFVTDKVLEDETKLAAVMNLINTLTDPYVNFCCINGIEGVNWEFNEDGIPVLTEKFLADIADPNKTATDAIDYMNSGADQFKFLAKTNNPSPYGTYMALKDDPVAAGDVRALERQTRLIGLNYDGTFFGTMNNNATDDMLYNLANIDATFSTSVYEPILAATEEECVELFNKYIASLESMGLCELEEYWNAEYQAYLGK